MPIAQPLTPDIVERLTHRLGPRFGGTIRTDRLIRALYSTDASIYELVPDVVLFPKSVHDVREAVRACAEMGVAITPRGAGTGLTGAAVNHGVQLDCSRHLDRILEIDPARRVAVVEPGVVLDHLNAALAPHGLQFAPDVATSSRATIGGMIANNSCGAHSIRYGRTVDHVLGLDVALADGSMVHWSCDHHNTVAGNPLARRCDVVLREILETHADEIAARFPKVLRSNAGYGLDRLRIDSSGGPGFQPRGHDDRATVGAMLAPDVGTRSANDEPPHFLNTHALLCGSEGTLGVVTRAVLNLEPLPKAKGLLVVQFSALLDALGAVPAALSHGPAAVELIDENIIAAARKNLKLASGSKAIRGNPAGVLVIEIHEDDRSRLRERLDTVERDMREKDLGDGHTILVEAAEQEAVWDMRKAGLGLLMSKPGDRQPHAFVEDTAVDPARLRDYIARFAEILASENVDQAGYYAHASVGCLHVRPVLNLKRANDVACMRRIAERVSRLAFEFGGTMSGEHGDGLVRSEWIELLYGHRLVEAFRRIKRTFDAQNILNPGKIVDPPRMTEHLRYGGSFAANRDARGESTMDFSLHGGMAGLAGMCSGVGQCRQRHVGAMCPSYEGTGDEMHTTRARANALRIAMSNRSLLTSLDDAALDEVMDLCISCKACKTECPTGVDMARLKAEWQHRRHQTKGAPLRSRLIARTAQLARVAGKVPGLANAVAQSVFARRMADRFLGIDRRVPPPVLARQTFRDWFNARREPRADADKRVLYFVDTWTDLFTPDVGKAAVRVLEALGYNVVVPPAMCCGRPAISKGMLDVAREQLRHAVERLAPLLSDGVAIVGTEPSCLFTLVDEMPQLVRTADARRIADRSRMIETFLREAGGPGFQPWGHDDRHSEGTSASPGPTNSSGVFAGERSDRRILYHGHCHQKALVGTDDAMALLQCVTGNAVEINSGCCGMAGAFGHEREHYEVARSIGESRLFPAVRASDGAQIVVSGFSCRHQVAHHTGAPARHLIEVVAEYLSV